MPEQSLARGEQGHAPRSAQEQALAELVFEGVELPRQGRLRNMQPPRGAGDVALFGHGDEVVQLGEAHVGFLAQFRGAGQSYPKGIGPAAGARGTVAGMMVEIRSPAEIRAMRDAGRVAANTLAAVQAMLRPGVSTAEVDRFVRAHTRAQGATPSQLGYHGFPAAVCVSRNEVVCHGVPSEREVLAEGDIVNVDVTSCFKGWHGDTSATFRIGAVSAEAERVALAAQRARDAALAALCDGCRMGDLGAAIEAVARAHGCTVVDAFGGHGIGRKMHAAPHVAHTGRAGAGMRLRAGMVITLEPMLNLGGPEVEIDPDGWTVRTRDRALSAQFEHTVLITARGCERLTLPDSPDGAWWL